MLRSILTVAAVLLIAAGAQATDSIIVTAGLNATTGAGFGELTPGAHDLQVTIVGEEAGDEVQIESIYSEHWWEPVGTNSYVCYGVSEDELRTATFEGPYYDASLDEWGYTGVRTANVLFPCLDVCWDEGGGSQACECSLEEEGEVRIPVPGSRSVSVTVYHELGGTVTILGAGGGLEVLNPDESPFSSAYITGSGMHSVSLLLRADESFTGSVTLTCRFLQDGADLDSQDVVEAKPVVVDLDIAGVEEEDEEEVGGFVAVRTSDNPAPRKQITLKVEGLEEGNATLTRSNARVRVFTASEDGEEITFNGQDNTWPVNAVPGSLYVQGAAASLGFRDVVLTLSADGAGSDNVNFTVLLATFSEVRTGFRKGGAGGDPTNWDIPPAPVVATASPTAIAVDEQGNVEIALGIDGATRVTDPFDIEPVMDGMPPMPTGAIAFRVRGKSATPATDDDPPQPVIDCWMAARWTDPHGEVHVIGRRPPIVIVPRYIGCPFPQILPPQNQNDPDLRVVQGANRGLNRNTSPAMLDITPPKALLATSYVHWLTIQVQDQFRVNLDELYEGAPVRETFIGERRGRNRVINQVLDAQGRYQDSVGLYRDEPPPDEKPTTVVSDFTMIDGQTVAARNVADWEGMADPPRPPFPFPDTDPYPFPEPRAGQNEIRIPQRILVTVGGHQINPMINRTVIAVPPNNITIIWTAPEGHCPEPE